MAAEEFLLKWNDHQSKVIDIFSELCSQELLVDVTLACEERSFTAHKLILSACSPYFRKLFTRNPCKHPIVFLKDVKSDYVEALLKFMYKGEISITQNDLMPLIQTAKSLQIKGLTEVASTSTDKVRQKPVESSLATTTSLPTRREQSPPPKRKKVSSVVHESQSQISRSISSLGSPEVIPVEPTVETPPLTSSEKYISQPSGMTTADNFVSHSQNVTAAVLETDKPLCESTSKFEDEQKTPEVSESVSVDDTSFTEDQKPGHGQDSTEFTPERTNHSKIDSEFSAQRLSQNQSGTDFSTERPSQHQNTTEYGAQAGSHAPLSSKYTAESPTTDYPKQSPVQEQYSYGDYGQASMQTIKVEAEDDWNLTGHELSQLCEPTLVTGEQGPSLLGTGQQDVVPDPKNVPGGTQNRVCQFCHKSFNWRTLTRHVQNVHLDQRNYSCDVCKKRFKQRSHLTEHMRLHSGTGFRCERCGRLFRLLCRLSSHQQYCTLLTS